MCLFKRYNCLALHTGFDIYRLLSLIFVIRDIIMILIRCVISDFLSCNRWHFIMAGSTWHNLLSANCVFILSLLNSLIGSLSIHLKGEVYIMEKVYLQTNLKKNFSNLLCYNLFISYYHLAGRGNSYKLVLRNCILSRIYSCLLTTKLERPLFWWLHWVQHSIFMSLSSTC